MTSCYLAVLFRNQSDENRFQSLWWAQEGIPRHGLLAFHARVNQPYVERALSLHNNTQWPPRSLDLTTPCDFFLCGYLELLSEV